MAGTIDDIFATMNSATGDNVSLEGSTDNINPEEPDNDLPSTDEPNDSNQQPNPNEVKPATTPEELAAKKSVTPDPNLLQHKDDGKPKSDAKGNLVDGKGNVIATAGVQRRLYEQNDRMRQVITHKDTQINTLSQQLQQTQVLNALPSRLGINNEEVEGALRIAYAFKQNPVEAARLVVAEALKKGHNLDEIIGEQQAGTLQMSAISQMLKENLGPMQAERQQQQEQVRIKQESEAAFNQFLVNYPEAETNLQVIANLMAEDPLQGHPYQIAERAYLRLSDFCRRNGLDISKPLAEQVNNPAPAQVNQQRVPQQQRNARPLPSPNSGKAVTNASVAPSPVSANASWRDIINSVRQDFAQGS